MDPFDPRNWDRVLAEHDHHEHRIYLDDRAEEYAIVDAIDYQWAIQWRWCAKRDKCGKVYARRAVGENANGQRLATRTVYLHIEIEKRKKKKRRSSRHSYVDHRNGKSLDCRRGNLRWATPQQNNLNRFGFVAKQETLAL